MPGREGGDCKGDDERIPYPRRGVESIVKKKNRGLTGKVAKEQKVG